MKDQPSNTQLQTQTQDGRQWSYTGNTGPERWGDLSPEFRLCSCGTSQSPIDIRQTKSADEAPVTFHYEPSTVHVTVANYTLKAKLDNHGNSIDVDGVPYELVQFHFHAPSEHTINGARYAAELHLVHQNRAGDMAVVAVMITTGLHNTALAPIWDKAFAADNVENLGSVGHERHGDVILDIGHLLPDDAGMYRYSGSLTTPPCTEGIAWIVMEAPIEMSSEQLGFFTSHFSPNNRPLQPLNGREVIKYVR